MKPIVRVPNTVLTTPAKPVVLFDKKLATLVSSMKETLLATTNPKGVGLAAPQVGEPWRVFVTKPTEKSPVRAFVNPEIIKQSDEILNGIEDSEKKLEGCLSIPAVWGKVKRAHEITLRYQDIDGNPHQEIFVGFHAIIIQHETDHLDGILFTHRVVEQKGPLYESVKDKDGKETLEEIQLI